VNSYKPLIHKALRAYGSPIWFVPSGLGDPYPLALGTLSSCPPSAAPLTHQADSPIALEFFKEPLYLATGQPWQNLFQLGDGTCSPNRVQVVEEQGLVLLAIETAAPGVNSTLAKRRVEPPAQKIPRSAPATDGLDHTELSQPDEPRLEFVRDSFLAVNQVEHEEVLCRKGRERFLADSLQELDEA